MPALSFREVTIAGDPPEAGMLAFDSDSLVAVLVYLDKDYYDARGSWFMEAGFGPLSGEMPTFTTLDAAREWIEHRLARDN